jgi:hypothetical protein
VREDASALPAVEAARDGAPRTIPFGQISPGSASTEDPEEAIEDRAVVMGGSPDLRFLGWEQWLSPLLLRVGQISSVHTLEYTEQSRICKHALVEGEHCGPSGGLQERSDTHSHSIYAGLEIIELFSRHVGSCALLMLLAKSP